MKVRAARRIAGRAEVRVARAPVRRQLQRQERREHACRRHVAPVRVGAAGYLALQACHLAGDAAEGRLPVTERVRHDEVGRDRVQLVVEAHVAGLDLMEQARDDERLGYAGHPEGRVDRDGHVGLVLRPDSFGEKECIVAEYQRAGHRRGARASGHEGLVAEKRNKFLLDGFRYRSVGGCRVHGQEGHRRAAGGLRDRIHAHEEGEYHGGEEHHGRHAGAATRDQHKSTA